MRAFASLKISSFFDLTLSNTETGDGIELVLPSYPGVVSDNFDVSFNFEEEKKYHPLDECVAPLSALSFAI